MSEKVKTPEELYYSELENADDVEVCFFCGESFKECDTYILGLGRINGEIDVVKYSGLYWHSGCLVDWFKERL